MTITSIDIDREVVDTASKCAPAFILSGTETISFTGITDNGEFLTVSWTAERKMIPYDKEDLKNKLSLIHKILIS